MPKPLLAVALVLPLVSGGCVAKTVWDVATLPVKAGAQAADWATTSQEESDRNYGRKMRKKEAREGKERREAERRCRKNPEECGDYRGYRAGDED